MSKKIVCKANKDYAYVNNVDWFIPTQKELEYIFVMVLYIEAGRNTNTGLYLILKQELTRKNEQKDRSK